MRRPRLRAPELAGRGWLNTGGHDVTLAELRGKVVVLDFWTFCCVNCLHVLDELRPLEEEFADSLVLIGVHSPKFVHEADPEALAAAVERYAVHHPVLDDPELVTWQAYTARAWPTLVVIDPEGYVVASLSGEGHGPGLTSLVRELLEEHEAKGTLRRGDGPYVAPPAPATTLRFPGKAVETDDGGVVVTDTAHHQVVRLAEDLTTEVARWAAEPALTEPQGICRLPREVAEQVGYDLVVADSVGHRVRGLDTSSGRWTTLAGTGAQLRERSGEGPALEQELSTPWDVAWWQGVLVVAMAGTHQLWALQLRADPADNEIRVLAGTSAEGIRDGRGVEAWLAQPSGLATSVDGRTLWVADAETSAIRQVVLADESAGLAGGVVLRTPVGQGLFDFGHVDGAADQALLQHPLGLCALADGSVLVADTYNGALRRYDPATRTVSTVATGLREPSDVTVAGDPAAAPQDGVLVVTVVESAGHEVRRLGIRLDGQQVDGSSHTTRRPPTELAAGEVALEVSFVPPTGQKLDTRWGDPTQLMVSASPPALLREGAGTAQGLTRRLVLDERVGDGILHIGVRAAACDGDPVTGEIPEHAACHLYQQDWGLPVVLRAGAPDVLPLDLRGV
ncbi:NHL domain-containing thioredoxin family protein [Arsenicicoccus dermatophilus]|uniref:NHL domain-containing thioredoxin family protein n=1 Tax=Arsenicicoccus dermatophilus TaxID=1076331 RepID=UPI00391703F0